jgi:hypothetical protein
MTHCYQLSINEREEVSLRRKGEVVKPEPGFSSLAIGNILRIKN